MDIAAAFQYIFEDEEWVKKIGILIGITFLSGITLVLLFVGILGFAIIFSYQLDILRNVRDGNKPILPEWADFGERLTTGLKVIGGSIVYIIPLFIVGALIGAIFGVNRNSTVLLQFVLQPVGLLYGVLIAPMIALAMSALVDTGQISEFFQFQDLFNTAFTDNRDVTIQFLLYSFLASLAIGILSIIPCLGPFLSVGLGLPVQGHLYGQYVGMVKGKRKPKNDDPAVV